jgi:serine/threonine-protein kinase
MSTDPENEYFADGITEDVIAQLSKIGSLQVVSRTSVMPFKKREHSLPDIAARLGVQSLLDGSVRRAGPRVRIVAQLIDAKSDHPLWSETYDRELTDIFAIQSEVALRIAAALEASLTTEEKERITRRSTDDILAYQNYLLGRQSMMNFKTEGLIKSIQYFQQAVGHDAGFADAYAAMATAYIALGESGVNPPGESYTHASEAVEKALTLDPELSDAYSTLGYLKTVYEFDWEGAESAFRRAVQLSPSNADAWDHYFRLTSSLERFDESLEQARRAHALDPLTHRVDVVTALLRAGKHREAIDAGRFAVELGPDEARPRCTLGWAYFLSGDQVTGLKLLEEAVALESGTMWLGQLGEAYGLAGEETKARQILHSLLEQSRTRFVSPYHVAYVHTGLGEYYLAMDRLDEAFESRSGAIYGIKGSFLFRPLHGYPRFTAMLRRMNLA